MNVPNESLGISGLDDGRLIRQRLQISENYLMSWLGRVNYSYRSVTCLPCRSVPTVRRSSHPRIAGVSFHRERSPGGSVREVHAGDYGLLMMPSCVSYGVTGNNRVGDFSIYPSLTLSDYYSF